MTAPKPKVWMEHIPATTIMLDGKYPIDLDAKWWPNWSCDCEPERTRTGGRQWMGDDRSDIERAIEVATAHSRTHTAERVADELEIAAFAAAAINDTSAEHAIDMCAELIRTHLVDKP